MELVDEPWRRMVNRKILEDVDSGKSFPQIAREIGVETSTIYNQADKIKRVGLLDENGILTEVGKEVLASLRLFDQKLQIDKKTFKEDLWNEHYRAGLGLFYVERIDRKGIERVIPASGFECCGNTLSFAASNSCACPDCGTIYFIYKGIE